MLSLVFALFANVVTGTEVIIGPCNPSPDEVLVFDLSEMHVNNLLGSDPTQAQEIRFKGAAIFENKVLDLVLTADQDYLINSARTELEVNRVLGGGMVSLNLRSGSSSTIHFAVVTVENGVDVPVVIPRFQTSWLDIDTGRKITETLRFPDATTLIVAENAQYTYEDEAGVFKVTATTFGDGIDNPDADIPLTAQQVARTVTSVYEATSDFDVHLDNAGTGGWAGRNLIFSTIDIRLACIVGEETPSDATCVKANLLIVLDASSSIGYDNFVTTRDVLGDLLMDDDSQYNQEDVPDDSLYSEAARSCWRRKCFESGAINVGLLTFADYNAYQVELDRARPHKFTLGLVGDALYKDIPASLVNTEYSLPAFNQEADRPLGQYTQTDAALRRAKDILQAATDAGDDAQQVLFLVTDSEPRWRKAGDAQRTTLFDETALAGAQLRAGGVLTTALGIVNSNYSSLVTVAGTSQSVFTSPDFVHETLLLALDEISGNICERSDPTYEFMLLEPANGAWANTASPLTALMVAALALAAL